MNELATTSEPSVALMLQGALSNIQSGQITPEHVDVLGKMMDLYERNEKRQAEKDFAAAFVKLQTEMPQIVACKAVPGNDGTVRYKFAPFEEIMTKARPILSACGFGITFDTDIAEDRIAATCTLMHTGGHSISKKFACRIGTGPPKASAAQTDGAATTYAKRFALCAALNIVVETDDDARNEGSGETITADEAKELRRRVASLNANESRFLEFAGSDTYEGIAADKLQSVLDMLARKEREKSAKTEKKDADGNFVF